VQATQRLRKDKVEQYIDPRLGGGYPRKAVSKVTILLSLDVVCLSDRVSKFRSVQGDLNITIFFSSFKCNF
jgi:hypothetical protein